MPVKRLLFYRFQKHSPNNIREIVPAHLPLTSTNLDLLNTTTHARNRLFPVEEEDREKLSSIGSSSSGGHTLDTEAITDALIKFKSQSSTDALNPKRRQYSIDVVETSADESKRSLLQAKINCNRGSLGELDEQTGDYQDAVDGYETDKDTDTVQRIETGTVTDEWKECKDVEKEFGSVMDLGTWKEGDTEPIQKSNSVERKDDVVKLASICEEGEETTIAIPEKRPAGRTRYRYI